MTLRKFRTDFDSVTKPVACISINNLSEISASYSAKIAHSVLHILCVRTWLLSYDCTIISTTESETRVAPIDSDSRNVVFRTHDLASIDTALLVLGYPIACGDVVILPSLSVRIEQMSRTPLSRGERSGRKAAAPIRGASPAYVRDMLASVAVYEALAQRRFSFAMEPLAIESAGEEIVYDKCVLRLDLRGPQTAPVEAPGFVAPLERLGLVRRLDCFVLREVIALLRADPEICLACNISALSAVEDAWWTSIFDTLAREPDIATRLVVELTDPAVPADIERAFSFVRALDRLGCHVAVEGFGIEFDPMSIAVAPRPDVIKLGRSIR